MTRNEMLDKITKKYQKIKENGYKREPRKKHCEYDLVDVMVELDNYKKMLNNIGEVKERVEEVGNLQEYLEDLLVSYML